MEILISPDSSKYKVAEVLTVDVILQPNVFKSRFEELKGRITSGTKDFYGSLFEEANTEAFKKLEEKSKELGCDALCNVIVKPFFEDIRGDVFVGSVIQAYGLKKEEK